MGTNKLRQISTRLPVALASRLDAMAAEQGISRFELVRKILTHYIESYQPEIVAIQKTEAETLAVAIAAILGRLDRIEGALNLNPSPNHPPSRPPQAIASTQLEAVEPLASVEPVAAIDTDVGISFGELCKQLGGDPQKVRQRAKATGQNPIPVLERKSGIKWDTVSQRFFRR